MGLAVGLDIGNSKCVVAASTGGVVDAVLNEESKRETPTVVHFADRHRLFGAAGASCTTTKPASTISQLKRLVGCNFQEERCRPQFQTIIGADGSNSVKVTYCDKDMEFTAVEMLAMFLSHLKRTVEQGKGSVMSECVVGVPAYFSLQQKGAYRDAAVIAGWKPLKLLHEGVAAALEYATDRADYAADSVVVFVDIGHCDTQITIVRFKGQKICVLAEVCDADLGGMDFDELVYQHFMGMFEKRYKIDPNNLNKKVSVRLWSACEKAKRVLSANREADISMDYLMEGVEYASGVITREEFEKLSDKLLDRIVDKCCEAMQKAALDMGEIHSVELLGSGSRIPAISVRLSKFFGREMSRTLNGSEFAARGCALLCEMGMGVATRDLAFKEQIQGRGISEAVFSCRDIAVNIFSQEKRKEQQLEEQDRSNERAKYKRNALESRIYEERKRLKRQKTISSIANDDEILKKLEKMEEWLYGEGDDEYEGVYDAKLEELESLISAPRKRHSGEIPDDALAQKGPTSIIPTSNVEPEKKNKRKKPRDDKEERGLSYSDEGDRPTLDNAKGSEDEKDEENKTMGSSKNQQEWQSEITLQESKAPMDGSEEGERRTHNNSRVHKEKKQPACPMPKIPKRFKFHSKKNTTHDKHPNSRNPGEPSKGSMLKSSNIKSTILSWFKGCFPRKSATDIRWMQAQ